MKSIYFYLLMLCFVSILSCEKEDKTTEDITNVKLSKDSLELAAGGREKLFVESDETNTICNYHWSSSNLDVATVDKYGVVVAKAEGIATITLSSGVNSSKCQVKVVKTSISDLSLPFINYPISKDSHIFIEGKGFTKNSKIWLSENKISISKLTKSSSDDKNILASIIEVTENYLECYAELTEGWYSIMLEENNQKYNFGNIKVETPALGAYQYDANKLLWDDTDWRKFKLRGSVKQMVSKGTYGRFWSDSTTYKFNNKGFIEEYYVGDNMDKVTYQYDNQNRLIEKNDYGTASNYDVDRIRIKYVYGNHGLYIPLNLSGCLVYRPNFYHETIRDDNDITNAQSIYNYAAWAKGLTEISYEKFVNNTSIQPQTIKLNVSSNEVNLSFIERYDGLTEGEKYDYKFKYSGNLPIEIQCNSYSYYYNTSYSSIKNIEYSSNNLPSKIQYTPCSPFGYEYFNSGSPFLLPSSFVGGTYLNYKCIYDNNWNLTKYSWSKGACSSENTYNYVSYDKMGNWTQCVIVNKYNCQGESTSILKVSRDITYY